MRVLIAILLFLAAPAWGASVENRRNEYRQPVSTVDTSDAEVKPGDAVNNAFRVNCVSGCSGSPGSSDGAITDGVSSSIKATVLDLLNSNPVTVAITDGSGSQITSFGGGTQYTEGDIDASITGTALMWEDTSDTLRAVSAAKPLPVDVKNSSIAVTGTVTANQGSPPWQVQSNSANIATQTTAAAIQTGIELIDDTIATTGAAITGKGQAVSGTDGTNARILKTDTNGELQVDVLTLPSVTISTFPDNEPFNLNQIGGNAVSTGNGTSGTGVQRVTIASDSTGSIGPVPLTSGGTSISRTVSAASTNATNVKASAGQVYQVVASNVNAEERYVHLYDTSGTPTCNASIIATFIIPGATTGGGTNVTLNPGAAFGTGIGFCITTAVDGTGSVSANETVLNIFYK